MMVAFTIGCVVSGIVFLAFACCRASGLASQAEREVGICD